ncbi:MAG TPA: ABC transporter permease [Streptosporangiaceae bacterium]|jgi:ABC-2 type transport system permease protein
MTNLKLALTDSITMLRRDIRHAVSYPSVTISGFMVPVIMLLLFDGVFGRTLRAGLTGTLAGHGYVSYLVPGVLVMAAGGVAEATAVTVNTDMSEGLITRFKVMAIWRPAVLAGQVAGGMLRTVLTGAAVLAVAAGLGFSPSPDALSWLAALGLLMLLGFALSWLTVAFGLFARNPAGANSLALIPLFLPFVSSAFVPPGNMPAGVAEFAAYEPFTPIIDTFRGLLAGGPVGVHAVAAVAWCAGIAAVSFGWAVRLYNRDPRQAG